MSCTIFEFLNFHVSYLNYEKFNLCLQNTLNMSKTTRVYFGVLQVVEVVVMVVDSVYYGSSFSMLW